MDVVSTDRVPDQRRMRVRRFSVVQTANVAAILYLVLTAIIFIPVGLISGLVGGTIVGNFNGIFFVFAPIAYAVFGWIFVAIGCLVYNLCAGWIGGIEVTLEVSPAAGG